MFSIDIINFTKRRVPLQTLSKAASFAARHWRLQGELSLVLGGDKRLRSLNCDFRAKDKSTDVLSFSAPAMSAGVLGEIFINLDDCRRPSKYREVFSFSPSADYLLIFLMLHGLLHLAGYNDDTESERLAMIARGDKMMKELVKNAIIKAKL